MDNIKLTINNKEVVVPSGTTIMDAAKSIGIEIPRLCFLKNINETSACRVCVVEIEGIKTLKNSCTVKVAEGMVVKTNTKKIHETVKQNLELLAANHHFECWICSREHNCEFLDLLRRYHIDNHIVENPYHKMRKFIKNTSDALVIDSSKCLLCGRCVSTCEKMTGLGILNFNERGFDTYVSTALNHNLEDAGCIYCGKCIQACPVGALSENSQIEEVVNLLEDESVYKVVQVAPAVRVALGEEFDYKIGTNVEGKLYRALKELGFDDIVDTNFAADLTIMEETTELLNRLNSQMNGEDVALPLFTSCSPGWIRYLEIYYPNLIPHLSTCKSPQQMLGSVIKHYYADKIKVPKEKIKVISIMPCIAKKSEAKNPEFSVNGIPDIDYVLTTRELARLIKIFNIDFRSLKAYKPTSPLAEYTGAGVIFGATGGVMEAALRTVKDKFKIKDKDGIDITPLRGAEEGIKEVALKLGDKELIFAAVHGAVNFPKILEKIQNKEKEYAFVEFMACTGGCINGGGQPIVKAKVLEECDVRKLRLEALYNIDKKRKVRLSNKNNQIDKLYKEFFITPGSEVAHKYLHTHYHAKARYNNLD